MRTLLIVEVNTSAELSPNTFQVLTAAKQLGHEIDVLVLGSEALAQSLVNLQGVAQVYCVDKIEHVLAEQATAQVLALLSTQSYSHILLPASTFGKNLAPRIAAKLDVAQISDVIAIQSDTEFSHPIYAGNVIETVKTITPVVLTIRPTAFSKSTETAQSPVEVVKLDAVPVDPRVRFVSVQTQEGERPDLNSARVIVSGGRALGSAEQFEAVLAPLAQVLGAAIGASRAAVDAGYAPNDWQVGQTGKIVAPELYVAVGISGAIQHVAGIKDSKVIVAINKDPEAPIFKVADFGLVGDLFEVVPALTKALSE